MSNATTTSDPQTSYGSNAVHNRVRPGGTLGSQQYYYTTNAKTGQIDVNKYVKNGNDTVIGTIQKKAEGKLTQTTFTSNASAIEKSFFSTPSNIAKVKQQALQVAQKEWDGKTQPPPTQAIYGTNTINKAYDPAGSSTKASSVKNNTTAASAAASAALSEGLNALTSGGSLKDAANAAFSGGINSLLGSIKGAGDATVYPTSIRKTTQDYLKIEMLEFKGKSLSGYTWGKRPARNPVPGGTVILPIPGGIQSTDTVSWGQDKMDPMQTAMANIALAGIGEGFEGAGREVQAMAGQVQGGSAEIKDALKKTIAGAASGTGAQLMTRTTGQVLNPNMELLFKDPQLRQFNFSWKLAPRNKNEAQNVIKLIRFFKQGMSPSRSDSNLFLKSPNTWRLAYKHRGQDHKFLNKFKECAMLNFTAQYTPDGNYATFQDGIMTAYQITMAFQELEPVFSGDYDTDAPGNQIGY